MPSKSIGLWITQSLILAVVILCIAEPGRSQQSATSIETKSVTEADRVHSIESYLEKLFSPLGIKVGRLEINGERSECRSLHIHSTGAPGTLLAGTELLAKSPKRTLSIATEVLGKETLPRQRSVELSSDQLLVAGLNDSRELKWWTLILDPHLLRIEIASDEKLRVGSRAYQPTAEFLLVLPTNADIATLLFYRPVWTGKEFSLDLVGTLGLNR